MAALQLADMAQETSDGSVGDAVAGSEDEVGGSRGVPSLQGRLPARTHQVWEVDQVQVAKPGQVSQGQGQAGQPGVVQHQVM